MSIPASPIYFFISPAQAAGITMPFGTIITTITP
jgi:hypothetical protein